MWVRYNDTLRWSDTLTLMTLCCEIREGILALIWSIKVVYQQVIRFGNFIICFKPNIVQN